MHVIPHSGRILGRPVLRPPAELLRAVSERRPFSTEERGIGLRWLIAVVESSSGIATVDEALDAACRLEETPVAGASRRETAEAAARRRMVRLVAERLRPAVERDQDRRCSARSSLRALAGGSAQAGPHPAVRVITARPRVVRFDRRPEDADDDTGTRGRWSRP